MFNATSVIEYVTARMSLAAVSKFAGRPGLDPCGDVYSFRQNESLMHNQEIFSSWVKSK